MEDRNAFVVGYPIHHSRSPLIHNYWLSKYSIAGSYQKIEVVSSELSSFISNMKKNAFCGGNITLPHKEKIFSYCDLTTETAKKVGAINTIWFEGDRLCGDNTDVGGFLENLDAEAPHWADDCERAAVIGAGGAARAVLVGLAERKVPEVTILNRSGDRMAQLAEEARHWGFKLVQTRLLGEDSKPLNGEGLLVNTTSLGMTGQPKLSIDLDGLGAKAVVSDIVYAPLVTALLGNARSRGLRTSSGLGMLLHQAAPGFERWFGVRPQVTEELRKLIIADLEKAGL
jgi:shikimate dehydrogenase